MVFFSVANKTSFTFAAPATSEKAVWVRRAEGKDVVDPLVTTTVENGVATATAAGLNDTYSDTLWELNDPTCPTAVVRLQFRGRCHSCIRFSSSPAYLFIFLILSSHYNAAG